MDKVLHRYRSSSCSSISVLPLEDENMIESYNSEYSMIDKTQFTQRSLYQTLLEKSEIENLGTFTNQKNITHEFDDKQCHSPLNNNSLIMNNTGFREICEINFKFATSCSKKLFNTMVRYVYPISFSLAILLIAILINYQIGYASQISQLRSMVLRHSDLLASAVDQTKPGFDTSDDSTCKEYYTLLIELRRDRNELMSEISRCLQNEGELKASLEKLKSKCGNPDWMRNMREAFSHLAPKKIEQKICKKFGICLF